MALVKIQTNEQMIQREYQESVTIADALRDCKADFSMPCGGNHTCGKCKVIATGCLSPMSSEEKNRLLPEEITEHIRLACFAKIEGDATVTLLSEKTENILTTGTMEDFTLDPISGEMDGYGIAADIGTTTVVSYLYPLNNTKPVQIVSSHNQQSKFGADVISRIEYSNQNGILPLQQTIVSQLNQSFSELCQKQNISMDSVKGCVITGNTTMLHLLCGLDPHGIAVAPFIPQSLFGKTFSPKQIGLSLPEHCLVYLPRSISSYVGADITCAILASGMINKQGNSFIVDIGTNGEMALMANGKLKCCSTAAGPAFEGAGIRMGMSAHAGAIDRVWVENGEIAYSVIGKEKAVGICGSAIIDAVAVFLEYGLIDETGLINQDSENGTQYLIDQDEMALKIGNSEVFLTQSDIRKIQLAKSAICAGIDTLIHECDITVQQIDTFYIAGGFGSFINKESAAAIGLIPKEVVPCVSVIGNGAGSGAAMILLSADKKRQSESIAALAEDVELSSNAYFMDRYIDRMMFE